MRTWHMLTVIVLCVSSMASAPDPAFPGREWATRSPAEVELSADRLNAFSDFAGGFGCVIRHGYMVYSWGDPARRMDVASAAKPVYAHFLFRAVEDGRVSGLDEPVCQWEPRLQQINASLGHKDSRITWRHMANQISCYGLVEEPGAAYAYNDWQMALFVDALFAKVYGASHATVDSQVFHPLLTDLIGCQDDPTFLAFGADDRPGRLAISPRDFARFGLLYLHRGRWGDKQLLSPEHAKMAVTSPLPNSIPRAGDKAAEMIPGQRSLGSRQIPDNQTDHMGSYSWLWWVNGVDREGLRHWPDAPTDAFGCFGHGGMRAVVVFPSLDLIVSWNDTRIEGRDKENEALRLLLDAVVEPKGHAVSSADPSPRSSRPPLFLCGPGDPEGFLYRGTLNPDGTRAGDQMQLIEKLVPTGANCIYLMAIRSHGGDGDATHNPFIRNDPAQGMNAKVLDQWEQWFAEMDRHGIVIYFFIYDDDALVWNTGDEVGDREREFLQTLVSRFKHHKHLVWCVAEEYGEKLSAERVRRIARIIRDADDRGHVIAVHKNDGLDFSEFADDPCIDQFAIQYNVETAEQLHAGVVQARREAKGRYSVNLSEAADWGAGAESRRKCWACAMGGASVMVLGMDIASTPASDLEDCGTVVRFFQMVADRSSMEPHDELAHAGTQYVLAGPGGSYMIYASKPQAQVGLKGMTAGTYSFRWLDCASGRTVLQESVYVPAGDGTWARPEGIGDEVAVYLRRVGE
ncbi:MAG: serine hydrolase [Phycisphaerae bacterium]|nr:serine hydrolase [Phycisphaerae bacterium]